MAAAIYRFSQWLEGPGFGYFAAICLIAMMLLMGGAYEMRFG